MKHHARAVFKNVLIADDRASMSRSVRTLLERRHSELLVREVVDGVEVIEAAKATNPDLILLDHAIPCLNGAEAASVLKNTFPKRPSFLFTVSADLNADALCGFIGVDFLSKADGIAKLLEQVDACYHRVLTLKYPVVAEPLS
jgi:CheY-like chemotaxis protein